MITRTRRVYTSLLEISLFAAFAMLLVAGQVAAQPPDFSACDGLSGAAWGLCRGGVAAGCADGTGNETACGNIEETFSNVTGTEPPWVTPPVECPCDFSVIPMTSPPWSDRTQFICPEAGVFVAWTDGQRIDPIVGTELTSGSGAGPRCLAFSPQLGIDEQIEGITVDEYNACRQVAIEYGTALVAGLGETIIIDDSCTPTL